MASEKPGGLPIQYRAESIEAFLEVLQGRRSIRTGFLRDKPVPDELIEKILEAARWAPSAGNSQPWEFHAPVHVLVLGDPRTNDAYPMRTKLDKWEAHFYSSLANCVLQMLLAAEVLGLSSMYISDVASPYFSVMLKSLLGIPEPLQIYHLLPIGFAKRSPTIHHPRRALEEIVHHERYDRSKFRGEAELQDFMMKMSIRGTEYSF